MLTFISHVFQNRKKQYLLLLIILTLLSSFEFSFLGMYSSFLEYKFDYLTAASLNSIPFIALCVAVILSIFVVNYFIKSKSQEFSILLLSGRNPKDLFYYLFIQFGTIVLIAFILGIAGGMLILYSINSIINHSQLVTHLNYDFTLTLFMFSCFLFITMILIFAISAKQFVALDKNLADSLAHKATSKAIPYVISFSAVTKKKKIPIFSIISTLLILYLMVSNIFTLMKSALSLDTLLMSFMWVLGGVIVIVNTTIPLLYDFMHNTLLKHPVLMNSLSSFNNFCLSMITLINLNAVIVPLLLFVLFFASTEAILQVIIIPCFIMIVTMIALCLLLRFSIYEEDSRSHIATLHAIGYSPSILNLISFIKNALFSLFGFIIPLIFLIQLLIKAVNESYISQNTLYVLLGFYIILFTSLSIYMIIKERITTMEVIQDVKYINRG